MKKPRLSFARYNPFKRKQRRKQFALGFGIGLCALLIGVPILETKYGRGISQKTLECLLHKETNIKPSNKINTTVFALASLPTSQRAAQLEAIAHSKNTLERSRARYLLASDLLQQQQGKKALSLLSQLECNYPILAADIAQKRAQAYEIMGDKAQAKAAWEALLKSYPDEAVATEALLALGKKNPKDWEQMIEKFPSHPNTQEMARLWMKQYPNQPQWKLLLARYGFEKPGITKVLDELMARPERINGKRLDQPKPEEWEAIALGYWKDKKYTQASAAYAKAANNPRNLYLMGRGLQIMEKPAQATLAYKKLLRDFPNSREAASALIQLGKIEPEQGVNSYFDQVIAQFPDRAGEALIAKADKLDSLNNSKAAVETRNLLLSKYGNSDAAAEYRWKMAQIKAKSQDIKAALQWAQPILAQNPKSEVARSAGFWVGKWSKQLGLKQQAKEAFEQVVTYHPQSYYAWRSAVFLGWDVGDFTTVRQLTPQVEKSIERPLLPAGSDKLKELYQLGQDQDALTLWQGEFQNRIKPTVSQQFTDGLMRFIAGDYIEGIAQISKLEDRESPEEKAQFQALKKQSAYWEALYPFPYQEIIKNWSKPRQLNPLLVTALIRQESRFMPKIRSSANATGLMQVMPEVASTVASRINLQNYALDNPNDNVNLGTWLLDLNHQLYQNNSLLAVASYNAGTGKVATWLYERKLTDPDEFIESIPYPETKDYVKQVFSNYWNYLRLYNPKVGQQVAKYSPVEPITLRP
jgi:soluble lytic murein transglycosylase